MPNSECPAPLRRPSRTAILGGLLAVLALTSAAYLPILSNGFISIDDPVYITENGAIREGITQEAVRWSLTTDRAGNWHPVTWISHMVDVQLFGTTPAGHHAMSLLIHLLNTCLLFAALASITGSTPESLTVAALFALHPLHVESVAWAAERKDLLCGFFFLAAILAWRRYLGRPGPLRYGLVVAAFVLALLSKPMAVTFPFVLLLLDWWPLRRTASEGLASRLLEKAPLFALSAASSVLTYLVQRRGGWVKTVQDYPLDVRVGNAATSYISYLRKTVWPSDLAMPYGHPGSSPWDLRVLLAAALLATATILALRFARRAPHIAVGWLWYLGMLLPVIGLVQIADQAMADRYTYLPLVGIFIAAVFAAGSVIKSHRRLRLPAAILCIAILAPLPALTWRQASLWRDDGTLFRHAARVSPADELALNNLAGTLLDEGKLAEAEALCNDILARGQDTAMLRYNLGTVMIRMGRLGEAEAHLRRALELDPAFGLAHCNLGTLLIGMDRLGEAAAHLRRAVELKPDHALAHYNLARALDRQGLPTEAIPHYRQARRGGFDSPEALLRFGQALARTGKLEEAAVTFAEVVAVRPDWADAHFGLSEVLMLLGRTDEGRWHLEEAVRPRGSRN